MKLIINVLSICLVGFITIVNLHAQPSSIPINTQLDLLANPKLEFLKSANGKFIMVLDPNSMYTWNVDQKRIVYSIHFVNARYLALSTSGNIVISDAAWSKLWSTTIVGKPIASLSLNDNGNLELIGGAAGTEVFWSGNANNSPPMNTGNGDGEP